MGHEGHRDLSVQLLLDLRQIPVAVDRVRAERLVQLAEMDTEAGRPPGPAHARLGVDDHVRPREPRRHRRGEREDGRGRVAAGDRDQPRLLDLSLVQLGQPEHGRLQKVRRRVLLPVPPGIERGVVQAEVGAHVDDSCAVAEPCGGRGRASAMRKAGEHEIEAARQLGDERALDVEERKDLAVGLTRVRAGGQRAQLDSRMSRQQRDRGHAGVTVGARHPHFDQDLTTSC